MFGKQEPVRNEPVRTEPARNDDLAVEPQIVPVKATPDRARVNQELSPGTGSVSTIGESVHFKGELSAGEDLVIEGTVEGKINQGKCCLTLKPNGRIIADVHATKIFIDGTVEGDLRATVSVTVREAGRVTGNIIAPRVAIEDGAEFNGTIDMRDPSQAG